MHDFLGFVELFGGADGFLARIVLQIVKNEAGGVEFEDFFGGDGVNAQLQVAARFRFFLGFAGFVVDDLDVFAAQRINLVDSSL